MSRAVLNDSLSLRYLGAVPVIILREGWMERKTFPVGGRVFLECFLEDGGGGESNICFLVGGMVSH